MNGIRDLGFTDAVVRRINDAGQIVGTSGNAFVWDPVNGMRDLGNLGGTASIGMTINASGQAAGGADDPITGPDVAVAWSAAGEIRRLGNLPASGPWTAGCCSGGMDINDTGTVVGWALVDGDDVSRAVLWDPVQGIRDLGTLGGEDATANAINNAGRVVGESVTASGLQHATMWTLPTDTTPPTVTCTTPVPNFLLRQSGAKVTASVTDSGSGPVAATVSATANTSNVGARTVTLTGTDKAGNTRSVACPYTVGYKVAGGFFRPPVDGNGVVNVARAGKTVPVRWRITDAQGVPVANLSQVTVTWPTTAISATAPTDKIEWYTTAAAGLHYVGDGIYQYNWKTPASFAGTKHQLRLDLGEGKVRTALFRFTT